GGSRAAVRRWACGTLGLTRQEATDLAAMAEALAAEDVNMDREVQKALMAQRLERFVDRARRAGDMSNEIKGLKQYCTVMGLVRPLSGGEDGLMDDVLEVQRAQEAGEFPEYGDDYEYEALPPGK